MVSQIQKAGIRIKILFLFLMSVFSSVWIFIIFEGMKEKYLYGVVVFFLFLVFLLSVLLVKRVCHYQLGVVFLFASFLVNMVLLAGSMVFVNDGVFYYKTFLVLSFFTTFAGFFYFRKRYGSLFYDENDLVKRRVLDLKASTLDVERLPNIFEVDSSHFSYKKMFFLLFLFSILVGSISQNVQVFLGIIFGLLTAFFLGFILYLSYMVYLFAVAYEKENDVKLYVKGLC